MLTLNALGEFALVERITKWLPSDSRIIVGPGDDCAVVRGTADTQTDWVLTSDPLVQGIHFTADASPKAIGHKAVGRVLSDLAAMAAPYNPRRIADHDLDVLRRSMKFFGAVEAIVVNRRSGHIVGGHQRVRAAESGGIESLP